MTFHDVRMRGFKRRADVDEVLAWLAQLDVRFPVEAVPLEQAYGRVLRREVVSEVDVPGFARAAMDGWALRGEDTFGAAETDPLTLRVVGTSMPGVPHGGTVGKGEAVRIMTGAPVPDGADTVLRAEDGQQVGAALTVRAPSAVGRHVGAIGEDIERGTLVLPKSRVLRPQDLGVASSIGIRELTVAARIDVQVLITGDEIDPPGTQPDGARIVDANGPMLRALIERDGGCCTLRYVKDDADALRDAMQGCDAPILIVTGGSSVGDEDHAPRLLHELGDLAFHGIALRPAAPTGLGRLGEGHDATTVFLLPGNPVSCLCAYDLFVARLLGRLGHAPGGGARYPRIRAHLARKITSVLGRVDYVRIRREPEGITPVMTSGASILSSTTEADGFLLVPRDSEGYPAGAEVDAFLYDAGRS